MSVDSAPSARPQFLLDRRTAVPALIGRHQDFLIIAGLAGTARDIAHLTQDAAHSYAMAGAMGGATAMALGLALAQPHRQVLAITGDGELLMNLGTLATIGVLNPPNLAIICVDNGHYGETGNQESHTARGVALDRIAAGSGIPTVRAIEREEDLAEGSRLLREGNGTRFVLLRVNDGPPPAFRRIMQPATSRDRFRAALLGGPA